MPSPCGIWTLAKNLLYQRLEIHREGETPRWATIRNFYYEARNKYLQANPDRLTIDSKDKNPYIATHLLIKKFCIENSEEFGIAPELWWRLRDKLNIHPQGRAVCKGESGEFIITKKTRGKVVEDCSFILVCEKDTIVHNLLPALREENYKLNIVSTGGNSPSDVQEVILNLKEELGDDARFYILVLHDYDLAGVKILITLKQRYEGVIDLGVNRQFIEFLDSNGGFDARLAEEQTENKNYRENLREIIEEGLCTEYTLEDFEYLQGEKLGKRKWAGKRIEIDAIEVMYGIQPFVDYTLEKIQEECKVWDLSRIGVEDFYIYEPDEDPYLKAAYHREKFVSGKYRDKRSALTSHEEDIKQIVSKALTNTFELDRLSSRYRGNSRAWHRYYETYGSSVNSIEDLKEEFTDRRTKNYTAPFRDALAQINSQITRYEGDVREGGVKLRLQVLELQSNVNDSVENDPVLAEFKERLKETEYGEEELEAIEILSPTEEVRQVIEALESYLENLEADAE